MINLGLARISRLLKNVTLPWRAIHVAGTNGKGSVCAHISAMLKAGDVPVGRFTSPHLLDRWDCITINERTIDEDLFREAEREIEDYNKDQGIGASEFELLTATAFTLFAQQKIKIGVVEVGMGGKEDATNIIADPLATVITKIGLDHQGFLGDTIEEIASQKAGILKPRAPCVVDATNSRQVLEIIEKKSLQCQIGDLVYVPHHESEVQSRTWSVLSKNAYEPHQQIHICLAFEAVRIALSATHTVEEILPLLPAVEGTIWPGRLQTISLKGLIDRAKPILLDGAHNLQAAEVLKSFVDRKLRLAQVPITWVLAISSGKEVRGLLSSLLAPQDRLIACEFGAVAGMPWVQPVNREEIVSIAEMVGLGNAVVPEQRDVLSALELASQLSDGGPVVVAGSLYLVSDVLRAIRTATQKQAMSR